MNAAPPPLPTKEQIALLEPFQGLELRDIRVVSTSQQAAQALQELERLDTVGFDTE